MFEKRDEERENKKIIKEDREQIGLYYTRQKR